MIKIQTDLKALDKTKEQLEQAIIGLDKIVRVIAADIVVKITDRVQQKGEKSDGTKIGKYSEKKLAFKAITSSFGSLANKKQQAKRTKAFGSSEDFDGGYKEFRESLGRQTNFIDLTLTGDMMSDFTSEPDGPRSYKAGFRSDKAGKLAGYHEERFGPIFTPSADEEQYIEDSITQALDDLLK